jgi:hypothetical protein
VTTISAILALCALALLGAALLGVYVLGTSGTTHFRGRDFTNAGCQLDAASRRYRVPIRHWPGLGRGERAVAVQTVRAAFPTDVLVLTREGRCVSQWALEGGP